MTIVSTLLSCTEQPKNAPRSPVADSSVSKAKEVELHIDVRNLLSKRDTHDAVTVHVDYDPYFKSAKTYRGYYIDPLLDSIIKLNHFDTANAIAIFDCTDGYRPNMNLSRIFGRTRGLIAIEDLSKKQAGSVKFKPYYLVWEGAKKGVDSLVWPYELTAIRLVPMSMKNNKLK